MRETRKGEKDEEGGKKSVEENQGEERTGKEISRKEKRKEERRTNIR